MLDSSVVGDTAQGYLAITVLGCGSVVNLLALTAIAKTKFGLASYRYFLMSLAVSDLLLCSAILVYLLGHQLFNKWQLVCFVDIIHNVLMFFVFANLYNLIGMSIDHFLGIVYPLQYRYMINKSVAGMGLLAIWVLAFLSGFADIPFLLGVFFSKPARQSSKFDAPSVNCSPMTTEPIKFVRRSRAADAESPSVGVFQGIKVEDWRKALENQLSVNSSLFSGCHGDEETRQQQQQLLQELEVFADPDKATSSDWCYFVSNNKIWLELAAFVWTLISFLILSICYGRIFKIVVSQRKNRSIRKLIITTCLLLGIFAICWLPFAIFEITMWVIVEQSDEAYQRSPSLLVIHRIFTALQLLHPLLTPIIYVARLPNVRRTILYRCAQISPCCKKYVEKLHSTNQTLISLTLSMNRAPRRSTDNQSQAGSMITIDEFDRAIVNYGNEVSCRNNTLKNSVRMLPKLASQQWVQNPQPSSSATPLTLSRRTSLGGYAFNFTNGGDNANNAENIECCSKLLPSGESSEASSAKAIRTESGSGTSQSQV